MKRIRYLSQYLCILSLIIIAFPAGFAAILPQQFSIYCLVIGMSLTLYYIIYYYINGKYQLSRIIKCIFLICILVIISTLINKQDILRALKLCYQLIFSIIWSDVFLKKDFDGTLSILAKYGKISIVLNFILTIILPQGIFIDEQYHVYAFLNNINNMEIYWIPFIAFWILDAKKRHKNVFFELCLASVMVYYSCVVYKCTTGIVILIVMFIGSVWILYFEQIYAKVSIWIWVCSFGIAIVFFAFIGVKVFPFLEELWTLVQRFTLWGKSIEMILEHPIIGYGIGTSDEIVVYNQWRNYSPHNQFLIIALWGGLPLLLSFVIFIVRTTAASFKIKSKMLQLFRLYLVLFVVYYCLEMTFNMGLFVIFVMVIYSCSECRKN